MVEKVVYLMDKHMAKDLNMAQFVVPNQKLGWTWPPYIPMEVDIKIGMSYGEMIKPRDFIAKMNAVKASIE
jgi:hypothetical protein